MRVNLWIGTGALVVALATGLSRAGSYDFVYAGELVGIALMFSGFTFAGKAPVRASGPRTVPRPGVAEPLVRASRARNQAGRGVCSPRGIRATRRLQ